LREPLSPQDAAPRYQSHSEKRQCSYNQIGRTARRGHPPGASAGYNVFGVAYVTLRRVLVPNGRRVLASLADQVLTCSPIIVGVQVVGVRAVLRKFPLRFSVGSEVGAVQVAPTTATGATTTVTIGIALARLSVAVPIEVAGIVRVAL
jgi:hypothetical protein